MNKIYCIKCNKHRKFKNLKTSYIFDKTLVPPIICHKRGSKDETIFKKEESIDILKILDFTWHSNRNYKFCNRIENLCNDCRN